MRGRRSFTEEQVRFICETYPGTSGAELARLFNERYGTEHGADRIAAVAYRRGVRNGLCRKIKKGERVSPATEFKIGNVPFNKGQKGISYPGMEVTQYKKGNVPHNHRPVGSERVRSDGYVWVKVAEPNVCREKHRLVYEEHYGAIPPGHNVMFADGDRCNCDPSNLLLVTNAESASLTCRMRWSGNTRTDAEITKAELALMRLGAQIRKLERMGTDA